MPEPEPPGRDAASAPSTSSFTRRDVLSSASWATAQQLVILGSSAIIGVFLARTLGAEDFGVLSYATSMAQLGTAVTTAGLSGLAIKVLLDHPERHQQARTMSALIAIREAVAFIAYICLMLVALTSGSSTVWAATAIAVLILFARAWDAVDFWFQSRLQARRSASVRMVVVLGMLVVRIGALLAGAGIWVFLCLFLLEVVLYSGGLTVRYLRENGSPGFARPDFSAARGLLSRSWLLLLSSLANQVNLRADVIILQAIQGSLAVGVYSAAARLSEMMYFLPSVFMTATFPVLLSARRKHGGKSVQYRRMLQRSYDQAFWIGAAITAVIVALGPWAIGVLYGSAYDSAGDVLRIHVLALPFVFMGAVFSKWILAEDLLVASLVRHAAGAALNVALNLVLIPEWGLKGAAVATVVSYVTASYLACFIGGSTRQAGIQMSLAIFAPLRLAVSATRRVRRT